jgi:hypothetical protein
MRYERKGRTALTALAHHLRIKGWCQMTVVAKMLSDYDLSSGVAFIFNRSNSRGLRLSYEMRFVTNCQFVNIATIKRYSCTGCKSAATFY